VGFHAGYGLVQGEFERCAFGDFDGRRVGAFAGYNFDLSHDYIAGIEGDVNYDWNGRPFGGADRVGTNLSGSARVRAGYAIGNVLIYAAGGWTATNAFVKNPNDDQMAQGWTVGAGVDWAASQKMFLRAEYRFNNFSSVKLAGVNAKFDQDVINFGVAVKF
jgi:outer membrane immunogenic protein